MNPEFIIHAETCHWSQLPPSRVVFVTSPHPGLLLAIHDAPDGAIWVCNTVAQFKAERRAKGFTRAQIQEEIWRLPRYRELRFTDGVQAAQTLAVGEARAPCAADALQLSASGLLKLYCIFTLNSGNERESVWATLGKFLINQNRSDAYRFLESAVQHFQRNATYGQTARHTLKEIARLDPAAIKMLTGHESR